MQDQQNNQQNAMQQRLMQARDLYKQKTGVDFESKPEDAGPAVAVAEPPVVEKQAPKPEAIVPQQQAPQQQAPQQQMSATDLFQQRAIERWNKKVDAEESFKLESKFYRKDRKEKPEQEMPKEGEYFLDADGQLRRRESGRFYPTPEQEKGRTLQDKKEEEIRKRNMEIGNFSKVVPDSYISPDTEAERTRRLDKELKEYWAKKKGTAPLETPEIPEGMYMGLDGLGHYYNTDTRVSKEEFKKANPDVDIDRIQGEYFAGIMQEAKEDQLKFTGKGSAISGDEQSWGGYLGSKTPWIGSAMEIGALLALKPHFDAIEDGTATRRDYVVAGRYLAELEKEEGKGWWRGVGDIVADMPAFMIEFAAAGGGVATTTAKKGLKTAIESSAKMTAKELLKAGGKVAAKGAAKIGKVTLKQPHRIAEAAVRESMPEPTYDEATGRITFEGGSDNWARNVVRGTLDTGIETASEMSGGYTAGLIGKAMSGAVKPVKKVLDKVAPKTIKGAPKPARLDKKMWTHEIAAFQMKARVALQKKINKVANPKVREGIQKVFNAGGYNGIIEEYGEERLAELLRKATALSEYTDLDTDLGQTGEFFQGAFDVATAGNWQKLGDFGYHSAQQLAAFSVFPAGSMAAEGLSALDRAPSGREWRKLVLGTDTDGYFPSRKVRKQQWEATKKAQEAMRAGSAPISRVPVSAKIPGLVDTRPEAIEDKPDVIDHGKDVPTRQLYDAEGKPYTPKAVVKERAEKARKAAQQKQTESRAAEGTVRLSPEAAAVKRRQEVEEYKKSKVAKQAAAEREKLRAEKKDRLDKLPAEDKQWIKDTEDLIKSNPIFEGSEVDIDIVDGKKTATVTREDDRSVVFHYDKARTDRMIWNPKPMAGAPKGQIHLTSDASHTDINKQAIPWLVAEGVVSQEEIQAYPNLAQDYAKWANKRSLKKAKMEKATPLQKVFQKIYDFLEPIFTLQSSLFKDLEKRRSKSLMTDEMQEAIHVAQDAFLAKSLRGKTPPSMPGSKKPPKQPQTYRSGKPRPVWNPREPATKAEQKVADFMKARGKKFAFLDTPREATEPAGVHMTDSGYVFLFQGLADEVNRDFLSGKNLLWNVLGHEVAHQTKLDAAMPYNSKFYRARRKQWLKLNSKLDAYREFAENAGELDPSIPRKDWSYEEQQIGKEVQATLAGEFMSNPFFRKMLKQKEPGVYEKLKKKILQSVNSWGPKDQAKEMVLAEFRKTKGEKKPVEKKPLTAEQMQIISKAFKDKEKNDKLNPKPTGKFAEKNPDLIKKHFRTVDDFNEAAFDYMMMLDADQMKREMEREEGKKKSAGLKEKVLQGQKTLKDQSLKEYYQNHPHRKLIPTREEDVVEVCLIGCAAKKFKGWHKGIDLYDSRPFKQNVEYAEGTGMPWGILSAKFGFMDPYREYHDYDAELDTQEKRNAFGPKAVERVYEHLKNLGVDVENRQIKFTITAPKNYAKAFEDSRDFTHEVEIPMQGMGQGKRNQWLTEQIKEQKERKSLLEKDPVDSQMLADNLAAIEREEARRKAEAKKRQMPDYFTKDDNDNNQSFIEMLDQISREDPKQYNKAIREPLQDFMLGIKTPENSEVAKLEGSQLDSLAQSLTNPVQEWLFDWNQENLPMLQLDTVEKLAKALAVELNKTQTKQIPFSDYVPAKRKDEVYELLLTDFISGSGLPIPLMRAVRAVAPKITDDANFKNYHDAIIGRKGGLYKDKFKPTDPVAKDVVGQLVDKGDYLEIPEGLTLDSTAKYSDEQTALYDKAIIAIKLADTALKEANKSGLSFAEEAGEAAQNYLDDIEIKNKENKKLGLPAVNDPYEGDWSYLAETIEQFLYKNSGLEDKGDYIEIPFGFDFLRPTTLNHITPDIELQAGEAADLAEKLYVQHANEMPIENIADIADEEVMADIGVLLDTLYMEEFNETPWSEDADLEDFDRDPWDWNVEDRDAVADKIELTVFNYYKKLVKAKQDPTELESYEVPEEEQVEEEQEEEQVEREQGEEPQIYTDEDGNIKYDRLSDTALYRGITNGGRLDNQESRKEFAKRGVNYGGVQVYIGYDEFPIGADKKGGYGKWIDSKQKVGDAKDSLSKAIKKYASQLDKLIVKEAEKLGVPKGRGKLGLSKAKKYLEMLKKAEETAEKNPKLDKLRNEIEQAEQELEKAAGADEKAEYEFYSGIDTADVDWKKERPDIDFIGTEFLEGKKLVRLKGLTKGFHMDYHSHKMFYADKVKLGKFDKKKLKYEVMDLQGNPIGFLSRWEIANDYMTEEQAEEQRILEADHLQATIESQKLKDSKKPKKKPVKKVTLKQARESIRKEDPASSWFAGLRIEAKKVKAKAVKDIEFSEERFGRIPKSTLEYFDGKVQAWQYSGIKVGDTRSPKWASINAHYEEDKVKKGVEYTQIKTKKHLMYIPDAEGSESKKEERKAFYVGTFDNLLDAKHFAVMVERLGVVTHKAFVGEMSDDMKAEQSKMQAVYETFVQMRTNKNFDTDILEKAFVREIDTKRLESISPYMPDPEIEADIYLDAIDLGDQGLRHRMSKVGLAKVKELANIAPEFSFNPVFVVNQDYDLEFQGFTNFKFRLDLFNLDVDELKVGQTVGINLPSIGVKKITNQSVAEEKIIKLLKGFAAFSDSEAREIISKIPFDSKKLQNEILDRQGKLEQASVDYNRMQAREKVRIAKEQQLPDDSPDIRSTYQIRPPSKGLKAKPQGSPPRVPQPGSKGLKPQGPLSNAAIKQLFGLQGPELYKIAKILMAGGPLDVKKLRGAHGMFRYEVGTTNMDILINPTTAENEQALLQTLAHEIGHLIDYVPELLALSKKNNKGNLLARLEVLNNMLSKQQGFLPYMVEKDRRKIKRQAEKQAGPGASRETIQRIYEDMLIAQGILPLTRIRRELIEVTKAWSGDYTGLPKWYVNYRESPAELYAEALSMFLNSPGDLESMAPTFYNALIDYMNRNPEFLDAYSDVQLMMNGSDKDLSAQRTADLRKMFRDAGAHIHALGEEKKKTVKDSVRGMVSYLSQYGLDKHAAVTLKMGRRSPVGVNQADKDAARFALDELFTMNSDNNKFVREVKDTVVDPLKKYYMENGTREMGKMTEEEAGYHAQDDLGFFLFRQRVVNGDRQDKANPFATTPTSAKQDLVNMEARLGTDAYDELQKLALMFHDLVFEASENAVAEGVYSQQAMDEIIEPNRDYYAAFRVTKYIEDPMYIPAGIMKQVGTFDGVENVFHSTMLKVVSLNRLTKLNKAKNRVRVFLQNNFPDEITKVPTYYVGPGKPREPKGKPKAGYERIVELVDGKPVWWEVDKSIAKSFETSDIGGLDTVVGVMNSWTYKAFHPLFVTYNPGFIIKNPVKDLRRTYVNLGSIYKVSMLELFAEQIKAVPAAYRRTKGILDPVVKDMLDSAAIDIPFVGRDAGKRMLQSEENSLVAYDNMLKNAGLMEVRKGRLESIPYLGRVFRAIEAAGEITETATKIAGWRVMEKRNVPIQERAFNVRAYVGTPDYKKSGLFTSVTNGVFMYSRVKWNGLQADMNLATHSDTASGWWWRQLITTIMPTSFTKLTAYGGGSALMYFMLGLDPDDEEDMDSFLGQTVLWFHENYRRYGSYWTRAYDSIPLGLDEESKALFLSIPRDETSKLVATAYDHFTDLIMLGLGQDIKSGKTTGQVAGDLFAGVTWDAAAPSLSPTLLMLAKNGQYLLDKQPYDDFRDRYIVPDLHWQAGGHHAALKMLQWNIQQFGAPGQAVGYLMDLAEGDAAETTISEAALEAAGALTGIGSLIRRTDTGLKAEEYARIEVQQRHDAQFRLSLGYKAYSLATELNTLNRKEKSTSLGLNEKDRKRKYDLALYGNYVYEPARMAIREADLAADTQKGKSLRKKLLNTAELADKGQLPTLAKFDADKKDDITWGLSNAAYKGATTPPERKNYTTDGGFEKSVAEYNENQDAMIERMKHFFPTEKEAIDALMYHFRFDRVDDNGKPTRNKYQIKYLEAYDKRRKQIIRIYRTPNKGLKQK